jgi:glycerol-3-phosphate dehydrogenase
MYEEMCRELDVPFKRIGSLVAAFSEEEMDKIHELYERGLLNGVPSMEIIGKERLMEIEPHIRGNAVGALLAGTAGITSPYELCIAQAENAVENGVRLMLETEVKGIQRTDSGFILSTNRGDIRTRFLVNAAGLFADDINSMLGGEAFNITPRKGEYCLFDKSQGVLASHVIFQLPAKLGKGILITPTVHGNLLIGPNACDIDDREDLSTTSEGLEQVVRGANKAMDKFSMREVITSFAGLRSSVEGGDFIINCPIQGAVNAAGIDSPGLTAAPAIALMVVDMLRDHGLLLREKAYNPIRRVRKRFAEMDNSERAEAISRDPLYGRIICRCETVTEGEIVDAIKRPAGARTVDGIKRRLRAGMGRCQGGFCMPRIVEILSRELKVPYMDIVKDSREGFIFTGKLKDGLNARDGEVNA